MPVRQLTSSEARTFRAARWAALRSLNYTIGQLNSGNATVASVWMGVNTPQDLRLLAGRLGSILTALSNIHEGQIRLNTAVTWYAAVVPTDAAHGITLGPPFFATATYGNDSRAGTLIHETSHFNDVLGTDDHAYGQAACLRLVQQAQRNDANLRTVLNNADNWEYLVEHSY